MTTRFQANDWTADRVLSKVPHLKEMERSLLEDWLAAFSAKELEAGSTIMPPQLFGRLHLVASGKIELVRSNPITGRELAVGHLGAGDLFDVATLINGLPVYRDLYANAVEHSCILSLSLPEARQWLDANPRACRAFALYLCKQNERLETLAYSLALHSTETRLANFIIAHAGSFSKRNEGAAIANLTHERIARGIGSVRAVVNRRLQNWKRRGLIELSRKTITIHNWERFKRIGAN